jgi:hypothetical protein
MMFTQRKQRPLLLFGLSAFLLVPYLDSAQTAGVPAAKPNFSGRWRMVRDKSQFRGFKMPDIIVRVIDHHDPTLNLHTVQTSGKQTSMSDVSYFTNGAESSNSINGREAESKAFWDGTALMIRTNMLTAKGENEVVEDRWELSEDGKILTTVSHIQTNSGTADLTLVCEKQIAAK